LLNREYAKAVDELKTAQRLSNPPDPRILMLLSRVYAKIGKRKEALRMLTEMEEMKKSRYISNFDFALVYAGLDDFDKAFEFLERGFRNHDGNLVYVKADPLLAELRNDPRYFSLASRIGLEP
jgi:tetratricopeptide (TPR) repeat protein